MIRVGIAAVVLILLPFSVLGGEPPTSGPDRWAQWRGPLGTGVAPDGDPPVEWSEGQNVRWKTEIPGLGQSSPVVWGNRIFVTTAIPYGEPVDVEHEHADGAHHNMAPQRKQRLAVLAVDRKDGRVLWERIVREVIPHDSTHQSGSWASSSAVTDGERVYAFFGSGGLFALNLEGKSLWKADLGKMQIKHGHGEGSSPAIHGETLIVNWDHEAGSFVVALDTGNGKQRWKVARDERTSWSSPLVVEHDGKAQAIIAATNRVRAYDVASGEVIWECGGLSGNVVATPVAADGMVYVANSYETRAMLAIRLDAARGDITGTDAIAWTRDRDTPYVPSPILYEDTLCFLKHYQGILTCMNAGSGKSLFGPVRLPSIRDVYASPVGAAGRIYITDLAGTTVVLKRGSSLEVLAVNRLEDSFAASPAIVGNEIILRGERYLYAIAEDSTR